MKHSLLLFLHVLLFAVMPGIARSQCNAPTAIGSPTITAASCPGKGDIVVNGVTPAAATYQYQLRNTSNVVIKPWQDTAHFANVDAGSYVIEVRTVCTTGFSTPATRNATVANTYAPAAITGTTVNRNAQCNNGRFTTTATGSGPLQYALVTGLNVADIPANVVRPKQAANVFDSLAAGTYYVRAYDACGGYATQPVTIPAFTATPTFTQILFRRYACDSFTLSFWVNNINRSPNTQDTGKIRFWTTFPDGSTDTIASQNTSATNQSLAFPFSYSELDPAYNPTLHFPDNINTWPKNFTIGYKDACGNIFTQNVVMNDPDSLVLTVLFNEATASSTCDTVATYFAVHHKSTITQTYSSINPAVTYSLDNGATWSPSVASGYSIYSRNLLLPRGASYTLKVAYCGDTLTRTFTAPAQAALNITPAEDNTYACLGKTGLQFVSWNHNGPLTIEMLSAPAGQTLVPSFIDTFTTGTWRTPIPFRNLLPGAYSFRITDSISNCPDRTITINRTLTVPLQLNYTVSNNCAGALLINTTNLYARYGSTNNLMGSNFRVKVYDAANNQVLGGTNGFPGITTTIPNSTTVTISAASLGTLANGNYTIRGYLDFFTDHTNQTCTIVDKPYVKSANVLNLSDTRFIAGCNNDTNSAVIVGAATGGMAPYEYSLYRTTYTPDSLIVAPSSNNIFNNLAAGTTYFLQVNDQCGNGNNIALSVSQAGMPVIPNTSLMPCPGGSLQLKVDSMPNVTYQWYKDAATITGNTAPSMTLNNIQYADSGRYKVQVIMGTCTIMSRSFYLNPVLCGQPLAVSVASFNARAAGGKAYLHWTTHTESHSNGFDVERSTDGRQWQKIGFAGSLAPQGHSNTPLAYFFTDAMPASGINQYRLKHLETTGRYSYSEVRMLRFGTDSKVSVVPNPVKGRLYLVGNDQAQISHAVLSDAAGRVLRQNIPVQDGIDMSDLTPGMYLLQIVLRDGQVQTEKIIKQ